MVDILQKVCGSCGYPEEAGHRNGCEEARQQEFSDKDHSFEDLLSELNKVGLKKDNILDVCVEENLIGRGGNANVYNIPGVEKYVLRRVLRVFSQNQDRDDVAGEISKVEDPFPELNVGQPVAELVGKNLFFLKRQYGIPAGVPYGDIRNKGGELADSLYEEHLKRAADMPQSAYDEVIRLFLFLNEHGYHFDPSKANNLLIDTQNEKFNLVDVGKGAKNSVNNNPSYLICVLMDNSYTWKYKGNAPVKVYRKTILDKCIRAAEKIEWQIPPVGKNSTLDYSFQLAGQERTADK
jgi:hypothetical protein